jgi:hypothetical protein
MRKIRTPLRNYPYPYMHDRYPSSHDPYPYVHDQYPYVHDPYPSSRYCQPRSVLRCAHLPDAIGLIHELAPVFALW